MSANSITSKYMKLFLLSTFAIGLTSTASHAKTYYKNPVGEYGMYYFNKAQAKSSAVGRWEKKVAIKHGINFSFWNNAKKRSNVCKKQANNTWRCFAIGTPTYTKKVCKSKLKKHGMWYFNKQKAKDSAKGRWEKQAAINYGVSYSFWNNAKSKGFKCKKHDNNTWRCLARAKPCH